MYPTAHIGNVPVEEWLPFVVPLLVLYVYGRHRGRRRRAAIERLPDPRQALDQATVSRVLARWSAAKHSELSAEHVALLYPPGPEGVTASELAARIHRETAPVDRLLGELAELGYVDFEDQRDGAERRAWLTVEGYDLVNMAEQELFAVSNVAAERD
jgi:hypothetical protein